MPTKPEQQAAATPKKLILSSDFDYVEPTKTIAFKKSTDITNEAAKVRDAAIAAGKVAGDGQG